MAVAFRAAETVANGAPTTSVGVARPAGTTDGDALLAFVATSGDVTITAAPSGWNLLDHQTTGTALGDCRHYLYWKVAAGEPSTYTWTLSGTADNAAVVAAYSGTSAAPVQVSDVNLMTSGSSTVHTAPAVTPTGVPTRVVYAYAVNPVYDGNTTFTDPSGPTARAEADPGAGTTNRAVLKVFDMEKGTTTSTGDKSTTINNSAKGVAYSVVLDPSGAIPQSIVLDSRAGA